MPVGFHRWESFSQSWTRSADYYTHIRKTTPNKAVRLPLAGDSRGLAEHQRAGLEEVQAAQRNTE